MDEISKTQARQLHLNSSWGSRIRSLSRDAAVFLLSVPRHLNRTTGWIRFPYYHHVFDHERAGFARQIDYLKNFGDFISLDNAVSLLEQGAAIDGRFFCLSFDDGYRNWITNALPVLVEKGVPGAFFIPVQYVGTAPEPERWSRGAVRPSEQIHWDDCRILVAAGMVVGSHTCSHAHLVELDAQEIFRELKDSKQKIEEELGSPCEHFCCPWGRPGLDFLVERDPKIAQKLGYRSFLTTQRGAMRGGDSPYLIRRDHLMAHWGNYQLRYFLSRG